jgi:hypothetical protein
MRRIDLQLLYEPIVQRAMVYELQRADGVGNMFYAITLAVREIIHRIDTPFISRAVVMLMLDAVDNRVAEEKVGMSHIHLSS